MHRTLIISPNRIVSLEESIRNKNQVGVELEMTTARLKQENFILEERNKVLLGHLKHTPQASPKGASPQVLVSQVCGWVGGRIQ